MIALCFTDLDERKKDRIYRRYNTSFDVGIWTSVILFAILIFNKLLDYLFSLAVKDLKNIVGVLILIIGFFIYERVFGKGDKHEGIEAY